MATILPRRSGVCSQGSNSRNLLTNVTPNSTALSAISDSNTVLTNLKLGAANDTERKNLINFIRGFDPNDTSLSTERKSIGDPIHATPSLVTYGCSSFVNGACTKETQSAIFGTNEGFVQMFDTETGEEQFAFMPDILLPNIKRLRENAATGTNSHLYGMDNTVTVWANDANKNGVILNGATAETGEFVYAYATMGRGGAISTHWTLRTGQPLSCFGPLKGLWSLQQTRTDVVCARKSKNKNLWHYYRRSCFWRWLRPRSRHSDHPHS